MKKCVNNKKIGGFTLVELTIVMVIIGLLVAVITSGNNIIKAAAMKSLQGEGENIKLSTSAYFLETDKYPGDSNGNRKIEVFNGGAVATADSYESRKAWGDLATSGAYPNKVLQISGTAIAVREQQITQDIQTAVSGIDTDLPVFPNALPSKSSKGGGWSFEYRTYPNGGVNVVTLHTGAGYKLSVNKRSVSPATVSGTAGDLLLPTAGTVIEAFYERYNADAAGVLSNLVNPTKMFRDTVAKLDLKYDDGLPTTGNIRAINTRIMIAESSDLLSGYTSPGFSNTAEGCFDDVGTASPSGPNVNVYYTSASNGGPTYGYSDTASGYHACNLSFLALPFVK